MTNDNITTEIAIRDALIDEIRAFIVVNSAKEDLTLDDPDIASVGRLSTKTLRLLSAALKDVHPK